MPLEVYWDSNFKLKTLTPVYKDASASKVSPEALVAAVSEDIGVYPGGIVFQAQPDSTTNLLVELSLDGGLTFATGAFNYICQAGQIIEIPLQGVAVIRITSSANTNLSFTFLCQSV